jgi:hypothetical protein
LKLTGAAWATGIAKKALIVAAARAVFNLIIEKLPDICFAQFKSTDQATYKNIQLFKRLTIESPEHLVESVKISDTSDWSKTMEISAQAGREPK